MRFAFLIIAILVTTFTYAQDLSGIWRGSFISTDRLQYLLNPNDRYKLEVQLDQHDKAFNSVTYSYKTTLFYGKAVANGTFNPKTGKVWLEELKIVELKMQFGSACVMSYKLQYSKNDEEEFLEGTWTGYGEKDSVFCGRGTVLLRKVLTSDFYKEPFLTKRSPEKNRSLAIEPKKNIDSLAKKNTTNKTIAKKPLAKRPGGSVVKVAPAKPAAKPPTASTSKLPVVKPSSPPIAKTNPEKKAVTPPKANNPAGKNSTAQKQVPTNLPPKNPVATIKPVVPKAFEPAKENPETDTGRKTLLLIKKPALIVVPKVLTTREMELIKTITINTNEVSINLYDNGTIDHDTVSVYLDKKQVVTKQMLTTTPINFKFTMDENNDFHELVMVAENEGDIPPNTSLMVVRAGDKIYEVRITSTEQKNAVIIFKFEKK
ncbi:MAG: hypothetical protein ABIN89_09760 [Chitinophagaceae bacterium]